MAMRSLLSRNLTGATRRFSDNWGPNSRWPNPEKEIERQQKQKAEEKRRQEEAKKKKDDDKKSEGTGHHWWNMLKRH